MVSRDHDNQNQCTVVGFIADVQYADVDDRWNYNKTFMRRYRGSLESLKIAADCWSGRVQQEASANNMCCDQPGGECDQHRRDCDMQGRQCDKDRKSHSPCLKARGASRVDFVLNLGDLIDGFHNKTQESSMKALELTTKLLDSVGSQVVNVIGNHELYAFTRSDLLKGVNFGYQTGGFQVVRLNDAFDLIVLDSFVECLMQTGGFVPVSLKKEDGSLDRMDKDVAALISSHNANWSPMLPVSGDLVRGLEGDERRFAPYNGAFGDEQLLLFREALARVRSGKRLAIVASHIGFHPGATPNFDNKCLAFDYQKALDVLDEFPGTVPLVMSGHAHQQGICYERSSRTWHWTVPSPLEAQVPERFHSFGELLLPTSTHLESTPYITVIGHGAVPSLKIQLST